MCAGTISNIEAFERLCFQDIITVTSTENRRFPIMSSRETKPVSHLFLDIFSIGLNKSYENMTSLLIS